jgi:hypothetical protein
LTLGTLGRYLIGNKNAIETIAGNRGGLLIGFLFCFSAALARHYDGRDLTRQPWFLLAPAGASILTSLIIFAAVYFVSSIRSRTLIPNIGSSYLSFLGLYWMTAPLAWLYGIPYERFLNEVAAAQANIWTLELVSIWRVLVICRVVSILTPCLFLAAFLVVGSVSLALVCTAMSFGRVPLINVMGGVHVPASVEPVASLYLFVGFYGFFGLLVAGIGVLRLLITVDRDWTLAGFRAAQNRGVGKSLPLLAVLVSLGFCMVLPYTQREQRLRFEVESDLRTGKIEGAIRTLASHQRSEFPPQWTPPPWPEYEDGDRNPNMVEIARFLMRRKDVPEWVIGMYREKAQLYLRNHSTEKSDRITLIEFSGATD